MELRGIGTRRYRGHSTETTRVSTQKVRNYRSDRLIGLKFFHEFPEAVFYGVAWNRYGLPMSSGRGHSTDMTRVPGQKVRIYRSDRCIALKYFHEFLEAFFYGFACNRHYPPTVSGLGHSTERTRVPAQKVCNYRSDRWITLKFFS